MYNLPGVFEGNPWRFGVNGSLWTMPYEIKMYGILLLVWVLLCFAKANAIRSIKLLIIIGFLVSCAVVIVGHVLFSYDNRFAKLFFMFFTGAAFFVMQDHVRMSKHLVVVLILFLFSSALLAKDLFFVVYMLSISYVLFYMAYVPAGFVRRYNRVGDFSYGVYIYAFPIQQSIIALVPNVSVVEVVFLSLAITFLFAMASWFFIERHALGLKGVYVNKTRSVLRAR